MQSSTVIELKSFSFSYGNKPVHKDLNLLIEHGTVHGILGANGVGKSTLFNCLFHNYLHDAMHVAKGYEKELAYLQAEPYHYPYMTGMEYLKIICAKEKHADIKDWNSIFQLPLGEYVHNYSTGMKKKISLLGNILLDKKIILLDEPTNGLDLETNEFFKVLIAKLKQTGKTIIISSHVLEVLFSICDTITLISSIDKSATYTVENFGELKTTVQSNYGTDKQEMLDKLLQV
ncbi:MAG: ATP-binding cassette domain-containing protein [Flavipsychrobacter sp.]